MNVSQINQSFEILGPPNNRDNSSNNGSNNINIVGERKEFALLVALANLLGFQFKYALYSVGLLSSMIK